MQRPLATDKSQLNRGWRDPNVIVAILGLVIFGTIGIVGLYANYSSGHVAETITLTTTAGMSTVYVTGQLETSYITNIVSQPVTDPIAVVGLISVGVVAALVAILASRAFTRRP